MTTALLDGDIIAYQAASVCQREGGGWEDIPDIIHEPHFEEDDVILAVKKLVEVWTEGPGCTAHKVFLTGAGNFRTLVDPTYKQNRSGKVKPVALRFARQVLMDRYKATLIDGLEADDLLGLSLTGSYADGKGVVVSLDKDLATVPGLHFNPKKDRKVREVSLATADRFWMTQTLTGDVTDGYSGAPGIGPAKAAKALAGCTALRTMWDRVQATYATTKAPPGSALMNARLARILRRGDYDKTTKEVLLWTPSSKTRDRLPLPTSAATPSELTPANSP